MTASLCTCNQHMNTCDTMAYRYGVVWFSKNPYHILTCVTHFGRTMGSLAPVWKPIYYALQCSWSHCLKYDPDLQINSEHLRYILNREHTQSLTILCTPPCTIAIWCYKSLKIGGSKSRILRTFIQGENTLLVPR